MVGIHSSNCSSENSFDSASVVDERATLADGVRVRVLNLEVVDRRSLLLPRRRPNAYPAA
jgi:hypothetical protein